MNNRNSIRCMHRAVVSHHYTHIICQVNMHRTTASHACDVIVQSAITAAHCTDFPAPWLCTYKTCGCVWSAQIGNAFANNGSVSLNIILARITHTTQTSNCVSYKKKQQYGNKQTNKQNEIWNESISFRHTRIKYRPTWKNTTSSVASLSAE